MKNQLLVSLTFVITLFLISPAHSQTLEIATVPDSVSTFGFDYSRLLVSDSDQSILSGNYGLSYKHVLNDKINLLTEVNFIHSDFGFGGSSNDLGNILLGVQVKTHKKEDVRSALNLGLYVPTATRQAVNGLINNFFGFPKYVDDALSLHVGYNVFHFLDSGFRIGYQLGTDVLIPTGDGFDEVEALGKYGFSLMYQTDGGFYSQLELLGVAIITEDDSFDDNTLHTYSLGLGYNWDKVGAGLYYRNYFDEMGDQFNGIFGLQFNVFIK